MANLINIQNPSPRFNDNLVPTEYTTNIISGRANVEVTESNYSFNNLNSIKLRSLTTSTVVFDLDNYSVTIPKDGNYAFSVRLFKESPLYEWQLTCKIFINGSLYETFGNDIYSSSSDFVDGNWNIYGQVFPFSEGDIVTFRFEASTGTINNYLYISALKFEYLDKNFGLPSIYTYPKDYRIDVQGIYDYENTGSSQSFTGTAIYLTNDGDGTNTNKLYGLNEITDIYDTTNNVFDFSNLSKGDVVEIRINAEIETTTSNQSCVIDLELGIGGSPYLINWLNRDFKTATTHTNLTISNFIYIGNDLTKDFPAKFKFNSDANANVKLNGFAVIVRKK